MKKNNIKKITLLLLFLFLGTRTFYSQTNVQHLIRKSPYLLYQGKNTKYDVLWQLYNTKKCELSWGRDTTYSDGNIISKEYGEKHQHKFRFTNLSPQTRYYYKVTVDSVEYKNNFYSAPPDSAKSVKFIVYGDTRSHPDRHNMLAKRILQYFPEYQSIVIMSGDLVRRGQYEEDWDVDFFDAKYKYIRQLTGSAGYQIAPGNHEDLDDNQLFNEYFPYPFAKSTGNYWTFVYGPVQFFMVDQFTAGVFQSDSEQLKWLKSELQKSEKKWKVIVLHKPGWTTGYHKNNKQVQELIQPLCEKYGVKLVFAGHNHLYARAEVNGVYHITTGGGGAGGEHDLDFQRPNLVAASTKDHFCKVKIVADTLFLEAIDVTGKTIDSFYVSYNNNNTNR